MVQKQNEATNIYIYILYRRLAFLILHFLMAKKECLFLMRKFSKEDLL